MVDSIITVIARSNLNKSCILFVVVIYVEVKDIAEVKYLGSGFKKMKIVTIDLEKEERKPKIMIRGENEISRLMN